MTTPTITVRWSAGEQEFPPDRPVTIGRARDCDIALDSAVVSRHHGHLVPGPDGWEYVDDGSSRGSWVDGRRVPRLHVMGRTSLVLGEGADAVVLDLQPHGAGGLGAPGDADDATALPATEPARGERRPQAPPEPPGAVPATVVPQQRLTVEAGGRTHHFNPGHVVRIGRQDADVVLDQPSVSRRHATASFADGVWVLRDERSAQGLHVGGRRVPEVRLSGRTEVVFGAPDTGPRVVLTAGSPAGAARPDTGPVGSVDAVDAVGPIGPIGPVEAVGRVLGAYARFSGRARRSEFWWWYLFTNVVALVAVALDVAVMATEVVRFPVLTTLVTVVLLLPGLAVAVRRLHDTGRSGWWMLLGLVPLGGIVLLVFELLDSQPGTNRYGPHPKGGAAGGGAGTLDGHEVRTGGRLS